PIFDRRCIACHGCLASPCNVKLDSFRGAERGGYGQNPYSTHIGDDPRTDMDAAHSTTAWRKRGFFPILADSGSAQRNLDDSLLFALVDAGMQHNVPDFPRAALDGLRPQRHVATCPSTPEALAIELEKHPALGMPFGLPAVSAQDFATLRDWTAAGSLGPSAEQQAQARAVSNPQAVAAWEAFFNRPGKRSGLVSRFIFEHVFLATIVLEDSPGDQFRLVRSSTPPMRVIDDERGARVDYPPVRVIGTGLPYDDPYSFAGVDRFWYRLEKRTAAPVQKNHFLWQLKPSDIAHLRELFRLDDPNGWGPAAHADGALDPPWGIGNPFLVFSAIPAEARYRFLLENAEVIVGGITYGPVCNGQTATYAVKDQFWVWFLDPEQDPSVQDPKLGLDTWEVFMDRGAFGNAEYLDANAAALARLSPQGWSLDALWDGDGDNPNAWLTILRHQTNVSVLKGAQGGVPRTFWLLGYSGLERMYYDTVADFAYWAGDTSKLQTLLFFNYLRQEFEDNFLLLLPQEQREPIRERWTRGIGAIGLVMVPFASEDQPTKVQTRAADPLADLVAQIAAHLGPRISGLPDPLNPSTKPQPALYTPIESFDDWDSAISTLTAVKGLSFVPQLPSVVVLRLQDNELHRVYSLVANRVYKSQFTLVFQDGQALPEEDTMSVYPTLVNGFPNLFVDLDLADAGRFLDDLRAVQSKEDWQHFALRYGILRNSERFWPFYDWINDWNFRNRGDQAGWLDLTYYDAAEN
ncbi:MAG: fatty acid cis/trans isomerase, partial [Thiohalocapsa sp.]